MSPCEHIRFSTPNSHMNMTERDSRDFHIEIVEHLSSSGILFVFLERDVWEQVIMSRTNWSWILFYAHQSHLCSSVTYHMCWQKEVNKNSLDPAVRTSHFLHVQLKDKLRYIKFLRVYFSRNRFQSGGTKPEVVRSTSGQELRERLLQRRCGSKARKLFVWMQLECLLYLEETSWLFVVGNP